MSAITDAYRHALPMMMQSISPRLAALHASRDKLLSESNASTSNYTSTNACSGCGAMLHPNTTRRATRKAPRQTGSKPQGSSRLALSRLKTVTETCNNCGHVRRHEISRAALKEMPSVRRMRMRRRDIQMEEESVASLPSTPTPAPNPVLSRVTSKDASPSSLTPTTSTTPHPTGSPTPRTHAESSGKTRPKKRVGLQEMLARNRNQKDKAAV